MKRLKDVFVSSDLSLRERMIILGGIFGVVAIAAVLLVNLLQGQDPLIIALLAASDLLVLVVSYVGYRTRKLSVAAAFIILFAACIAFPAGYLYGGGVNSGSAQWFIACYLFVFTVFEGWQLWAFLGITTAAFGVTTYYAAVHPEAILPLQGLYGANWDSFVGTVGVGLLAGLLLKYHSVVLRHETEITQEQKEEIEKLNDAQNRFFSTMSHEIRTPINTIIGLNEMTLREKQLPEEVTENAINIQNASKMLLSLINDILDLSKIQSGRMEVVSVQYETGRMLSEIVNLLWNRAREKGLRFDIRVGDSIPSMLYGDEMRLKQVIVNLLTNAVKYTAEGSITLSIDGERREGNEFLLRVDVEDTGAGIRRENIPYLFDSFRRVDEKENRHIEGTGLGLSISKQLIELMGGSISVDSIYTVGSTFHIELPQHIVNDDPMTFRSVQETQRELTSYEQIFEAPEAHVLIVDDNDMNRIVSKKLLRGTRVQVDTASSGRECLEKTLAMHYDAIFMDHEMPEMDGIETLQHLRSQEGGLCRSTPVIALTANAGGDMQEFYLNHGFHAYLAKPISSALLEATLLQLLPAELVEKSEKLTGEEILNITASHKKRSLRITADCACDLPEDLLKMYDIQLIPMYVITENGRFRDLEEIDADNIALYVRSGKHTVTTEPCSVEEYERFFGAALAEAENVLHISVMSNISRAYDLACQAAESFHHVTVFDSGNMSSGLGFVVLKAGEMALRGESVETILEELSHYGERVQSFFMQPMATRDVTNRTLPGWLNYALHAFNLDPVFRIKRGKFRLWRAFFGYVSSTESQFIRKVLRGRTDLDTDRIFLAHCGCSVERREEIVEEIKKYANFREIVVQKASATVSVNGGRDAFGLICLKKEQ